MLLLTSFDWQLGVVQSCRSFRRRWKAQTFWLEVGTIKKILNNSANSVIVSTTAAPCKIRTGRARISLKPSIMKDPPEWKSPQRYPATLFPAKLESHLRNEEKPILLTVEQMALINLASDPRSF
jgi:hypothetical protein